MTTTRRKPPTEEVAFKPVDNTRLAALCGPLDANLRQIETALDVTIARRGERFSVAGPKDKADRAAEALRRFYDRAGREELSVEDIQLGLVEMTRKRTRESLAHVLCEPCPVCEGRGELKTAQTVCYQVLRELMREARQFDAREFRILASQQVIDMFLDEESQSLAILSDVIGKPVSLQVESLYNQEQFDIVLM